MPRLLITQKEIAEALGVSGAMVCKHKAMGMPVDSLENALEWRKANLEPSFTIDYRRTRHPRHQAKRGELLKELARAQGGKALSKGVTTLSPYAAALESTGLLRELVAGQAAILGELRGLRADLRRKPADAQGDL